MRIVNQLPLMILFFVCSCDATNTIFYTVENKTDKTIFIKVPKNIGDQGFFSELSDTIIEIPSEENSIIGFSTDIDFPWKTKSIYKNTPGVCGLELVKKDTSILLNCTNKEWRYKKRNSVLFVR